MQQALEVLDAAGVRRWARAALLVLEVRQAEVDRLNVFPVADRDTGTNLVTTMRASAQALAAEETDDVTQALDRLATGAVLGAAGNSGTILAQVLRSLADVVAEAGRLDGPALARALQLAAERARQAVSQPVDGTVISVLAAVAAAVSSGGQRRELSIVAVANAALHSAQSALERTPQQLPVLAASGVVDAGGRGLVLVLVALVAVLTGADADPLALDVPAGGAPLSGVRPDEVSTAGGSYEIQYVLHATGDEAFAADLRAALDEVADSVVVVASGHGAFAVHAHAHDIGAVLERGLSRGQASRIAIERIAERPAGPEAVRALRRGIVAVVPPAAGAATGLASVLEKEGVHVLPDALPPPGSSVGAEWCEAVLLGDVVSSGAVAAAAQRLRARGVRVAVVPTRSPVQTLAAVAVHDHTRAFDDDVVAMAEAAAGTRVAEFVAADQEALTSAGRCEPGDILGLIDGEVVEVGRGLLAVALAVTDRLLGVGAELITVAVAADAGTGVAETLRRHVVDRSPLTDVAIYEVAPTGGAGSAVLLGVE